MRSVRWRALVEGAEQGPRAPALLLRSLTTKENWGEGDCVALQPEKQQPMNQGKTKNRAEGEGGGKRRRTGPGWDLGARGVLEAWRRSEQPCAPRRGCRRPGELLMSRGGRRILGQPLRPSHSPEPPSFCRRVAAPGRRGPGIQGGPGRRGLRTPQPVDLGYPSPRGKPPPNTWAQFQTQGPPESTAGRC